MLYFGNYINISVEYWIHFCSIIIREKYGIQIKPAHDTGTEAQHEPHSCSHHNHYVTSGIAQMIIWVQLCIDAGGNHLQHLQWRYILSALSYCINFSIYSMLRTRPTFSWPILYYPNKHNTWTRYVHLLNSSTCFCRYIKKSTVVFNLQTVECEGRNTSLHSNDFL